jgi:hypothetical protein
VKQIRTDGGRRDAGFTGHAQDCVVRAVAIVTARPYDVVYYELAEINAKTRKTKRRVGSTGKHTASHGIYTTTPMFKRYMQSLGFVWTPTMGIGTGCKVHLRDGELPMGRLVVAVSRHYTAVIDGVLLDTHDCTRGGNRCVYGIWRLA